MIYIFMGGPATGKGTRSEILANHLNIPHISTGEILRDVSKTDEDLAKRLSKGKLVPDEEMTSILKARIQKDDCKKGFVLDGYPRTLNQVYALNSILEELGRSITKVFELVISDELALRRILERKKCEYCGKDYGLDFPPKVEGICDNCGHKLSKRTDDTKETLELRIKTYKKNSKEILDYYREVGLLKTVDASNHPEKVIYDI